MNLLGACRLRDWATHLLLLLEGELEGLLLHELLIYCGVRSMLWDHGNILATDFFLYFFRRGIYCRQLYVIQALNLVWLTACVLHVYHLFIVSLSSWQVLVVLGTACLPTSLVVIARLVDRRSHFLINALVFVILAMSRKILFLRNNPLIDRVKLVLRLVRLL